MAAPRLYRVIVPVSDIEAAVRFYSRIFETKGERVSPGRHYFDCGGVVLACYDPAADTDDVGDGWLFHDNQYIYFSVSDLEGMRNRIHAAGGHNLTEIEAMPWGETLFYAVDPFGSRLSFVRDDTVFTGTVTP